MRMNRSLQHIALRCGLLLLLGCISQRKSAQFPFFDDRTGEFWSYNWYDGQVRQGYRVTKLGQPLVKAK